MQSGAVTACAHWAYTSILHIHGTLFVPILLVAGAMIVGHQRVSMLLHTQCSMATMVVLVGKASGQLTNGHADVQVSMRTTTRDGKRLGEQMAAHGGCRVATC